MPSPGALGGLDAAAWLRQVWLHCFATYAPIKRRELRQRDTENVKHCDQSVSQSQAHTSNSFIAPRAHQDPFVAVGHAAAVLKPAKKFHVFHQRHFWKASNVHEGRTPTE